MPGSGIFLKTTKLRNSFLLQKSNHSGLSQSTEPAKKSRKKMKIESFLCVVGSAPVGLLSSEEEHTQQ